jgi:hypothetical protein
MLWRERISERILTNRNSSVAIKLNIKIIFQFSYFLFCRSNIYLTFNFLSICFVCFSVIYKNNKDFLFSFITYSQPTRVAVVVAVVTHCMILIFFISVFIESPHYDAILFYSRRLSIVFIILSLNLTS